MNGYKRYQDEADKITSQPLTPSSRARLQFLLSSMKTMREFGLDKESAVQAQDPLALRNAFLKSLQTRTYVPMNLSDDSALVPTNVEVKLLNRMINYGPFVAGSPLFTNLPTNAMQSSRIAVSDDETAGQVITENTTPADDAELVGLSSVSVGGASSFFTSGIQLASASLVDDARSSSWSSFEDLLVKAVGRRVSQIQNATFFPALKTALAANTSAAVANDGPSVGASDINNLITSVAPADRANGCFVLSQAKQKEIYDIRNDGAQREYPHVLDSVPSILGYPVYVQSGAADADCYFGDFSWMVCKFEPLSIRTLRERFLAQGFVGFVVGQRAEAKWAQKSTSDSSVKYLAFS